MGSMKMEAGITVSIFLTYLDLNFRGDYENRDMWASKSKSVKSQF
jgi:negative regulator of genetic competence, sporulation and motility